MQLSIESGHLNVKLEGWERVWAFHGSLRIPTTAIASVEARDAGDRPPDFWRGLRVPGAFIPWVIKAGTYYASVGWEFWYYPWGKPFLVLHLTEGRFRRVVLGTDDAFQWAERIRQASPRAEQTTDELRP